MKISINIELPDNVDFECIREYIHQSLVQFQSDTSDEFVFEPEQIVFDFKIE
jgi:hypothetical protein